ncbi:hypothetical protein R3W88_012205 [Solanum pinnatisectum]|uniref:Late embryogenesis abundant protein n=1 Tax=Solanum pinnatisectum TaxID=50273 RepID=A0AAV9L899_9SOLN|nr:hypothetical protein R3W88_012205 [Solanum pinnatisectum]
MFGEVNDYSACHRVARRARLISPNGQELDGFSGQRFKSFADMTISKAAERIIPAQVKTKGIAINEDVAISRGKATKFPTTGGKTTIRDPNVPSWARGFCAAVHVFLEESHVTAPSGSSTAITPEVIPSTDAQNQSNASGTDAQTDGATV